MKKRVLIIAPHPDDEINIAGQLIVSLKAKKYEIYVLYTTNGDSEVKIGNRRIQEAIEANGVLGVDEQHVFLLGYPNEWLGSRHIYNSEGALVSKLGKTVTNSLEKYPEYCYKKCGVHHTFSRSNFKSDYRGLIEELLPDVIVYPEFDSHPDHRCASLLCDEIIGELLKKRPNYKPILLKKYIHEGVWYGKKDYYTYPPMPTLTDGERTYSGSAHDLDSPDHKWSDRISYSVEVCTTTKLLKDNILYQAAKKHKSTTAWYEMQRVINGDMVYWYRPIDNAAIMSTISATSGDVSYINDFKHFDSDNVYDIKEPFVNSEKFCWQPLEEDNDKILFVRLQNSMSIRVIRLYEDCNKQNHISQLNIFVDGELLKSVEMNPDGSHTDVVLENVYTDEIRFKVVKWVGTPGISEIEIYSDERSLSCPLELEKYRSHTNYKTTLNIWQKLEQVTLKIRFLFAFKIEYEIKRALGHFRAKN